jgi:phosphoserine phosphatase
MSDYTVIAVVFDFDDTLAPDSTTFFLQEHGIDVDAFWLRDVKSLVQSGYDPTHAYLRKLLDNVGDGKPLGRLTNRELSDFGRKLDSKFFPGIPELFGDLTNTVKEFRDIGIEYYIISGGLENIVSGSEIVSKNFSGVYGCRLGGDTDEGPLKYIKRAITFTEKTRYLFEINKGISPSKVIEKPYLVNKSRPHKERRIRFSNMIYVGDGLTDIPCFSLVKNGAGDPAGGGITFGVFDITKEKSAKQALDEYLIPGRVSSAHAPYYTKDRELGVFIRSAVAGICHRIKLREEEVEERLTTE